MATTASQVLAAVLMLGALGAGVGCAARASTPPEWTAGSRAPHARRAFEPMLQGRWIGNAIAYGPHRDGQAPGGPDPSSTELLADLRIMAEHWNLLRVYGSTGPTPTILALIREHRLPLRVMLGAWLAPEVRRDSTGEVVEHLPAAVAANDEQVSSAIRLAREFEDIVIAVAAGNETQVSWSAHRFGSEQLLRDIRRLRAGVRQPVTTADDYNFWNRPESRTVAAEIDFITMHAHPLWNGKLPDEALPWTVATVESIRRHHPEHVVVLGESGWATQVHDEGEQARLIRGEASETQQRAFHAALTKWAERTRTTTFFFEAFDERWKGGPHPNEVEKHWGLFRADRSPKAAMSVGQQP